MTEPDHKKLAREYRKALESLTKDVKSYLTLLDEAMKLSPTIRGPRLADLVNKLEMRNDMVLRFTLGKKLNRIDP